LTKLELTGTIGSAALLQLPKVAPAGLQELLLPQRLWKVGWSDLASLQVGALQCLLCLVELRLLKLAVCAGVCYTMCQTSRDGYVQLYTSGCIIDVARSQKACSSAAAASICWQVQQPVALHPICSVDASHIPCFHGLLLLLQKLTGLTSLLVVLLRLVSMPDCSYSEHDCCCCCCCCCCCRS
jgi:hypothetical protein